MEIYVAIDGTDRGTGTVSEPLRTISAAAAIAQPGDVVIVHEGIYREWVKPAHAGLSDQRRIIYQAAEGERVVISGSEILTDWERIYQAWRARVPNTRFGAFNPYLETIEGDWLVRPDSAEAPLHLGEVYLNGEALFEVRTLDEVIRPRMREELVDDWTQVPQSGTEVLCPKVWHAVVDDEFTTIYANFGDIDPNQELVEFNVRRSVFYPAEHHIDFITVRGFELCHAATPWAPPTADQPGLVGPNWARGWVIEDNLVHDAKCAAISLGKEIATGHNFATYRKDKPGYQYQLEAVFAAEEYGWSKEHIGSHLVRNNTIYNCGQNGIVGHLGCAYSVIDGNHIYNIGIRRQFYGHEIAGVKFHAAIDAQIRNNHIHDCSLGLWLDWQTQGTRISRNFFHSNSRDFFVEVSHGPYIVDGNLFASPVSVENFSQGGAYVGNLFLGSLRVFPVRDRATPYHRPHSTKIAGYAIVENGDDRFVGNVFGGEESRENYRINFSNPKAIGFGLSAYEGFPASFEEYMDRTQATVGDHDRFAAIPQQLEARSNSYFGAARCFEGEPDAVMVAQGVARVEYVSGVLTLETRFSEAASRTVRVSGSELGRVRFVGAEFEAPDGSELIIDTTDGITSKLPAHEARRVLWRKA